MGALGSISLLPAVVAFLSVAIVAATCGYVAASVARRNKRRARGYFALGFCCGSIVSAFRHRMPRGRRRGGNRLKAILAPLVPIGRTVGK